MVQSEIFKLYVNIWSVLSRKCSLSALSIFICPHSHVGFTCMGVDLIYYAVCSKKKVCTKGNKIIFGRP